MNSEYNEVSYLQAIVAPLVNNIDAISITRTNDEMGILLTLQVAKDDMGKVIGKEGNNAKSIRTLVNALGMKNHLKISVKIAEPTL